MHQKPHQKLHRKLSKKYAQKGIEYIVGIDEAGRGALAGPVAVGAVKMRVEYFPLWLKAIKDSKKLSPKQRVAWLTKLESDAHIESAYALIGNNHIDTKGIVSAVSLGIARVLKMVSADPASSVILLDGGIHAPKEYTLQETIIKGDEKVACIALASITAKVHRDAYMVKLGNKLPQYQFARHKGYGTKLHQQMIKKHGLSNQHRVTFCH